MEEETIYMNESRHMAHNTGGDVLVLDGETGSRLMGNLWQRENFEFGVTLFLS